MEENFYDELIRAARLLDGVLTARRIDHAFIGGLAVNAWSVPVPTYDIDVCAGVAEDSVPDLIDALTAEGFEPPPTTWLESIGPERFREFTVHWPFGLGFIDADVFLATDPFQQQVLPRRRRVELEEGFTTDIVTPEDLLLYKLLAYRKKDQAAVERLLMIQRDLDWAYVQKWADRFAIAARLSDALRDAGIE